MSGYLEVKYPFKSNLGLNPFKCWKKQWCILRPGPCGVGGSLAVYCSEAGSAGQAAGSVPLPSGAAVRRAKSRSRRFAFAVFAADDPRKPRVLLAAPTLHDTESWMDKIKALLNGDKMLGTETLLKDSYSVNVIATDLSVKCGLSFHPVVTLSSSGVRVDDQGVYIEWRLIGDVSLITEDDDRVCVITVHSDFEGGGELKLCGSSVSELAQALKQVRLENKQLNIRPKLCHSDGDLRAKTDADLGDVRRSSWYSGPSEVSLDDIDLVMSKEWSQPSLSRCSAERDLAPRGRTQTCPDSMSDRRSLLSVASGIYEEIPDLPDVDHSVYCKMGAHETITKEPLVKEPTKVTPSREPIKMDEPTYESVADCVYATMRRTGKRFPPPLPPRAPLSGWSASAEALPWGAATLPKQRNTFSVFRKRLKSDSRLATSPKSDSSKENKDIETKKKRFDFTPTRDIFKNFKVSRKMKNLKITTGLSKGETKSCEFLDEEHVQTCTKRCSKSVECLENNLTDDDKDLSIEFNDDAVDALALPQEILELILRSREQIHKIRLKENQVENDYMPMSPTIPQPPMDHYIVMSPKTNLA